MPRVSIGEDVLRQGYALQHLPECQILGQQLFVGQCPMHIRMPVIVVKVVSLCLDDSKRPSHTFETRWVIGEADSYQACQSLQGLNIRTIASAFRRLWARLKGWTEPQQGENILILCAVGCRSVTNLLTNTESREWLMQTLDDSRQLDEGYDTTGIES